MGIFKIDNKMKVKIVVTIIALVVSGTITYAQNKTDVRKNDSLSVKNIQHPDSVYYGCVPCCQACSIYTTDKPGECPHCGMTLEKRTYRTVNGKKEELLPLNNNTCKPPKAKKHGK